MRNSGAACASSPRERCALSLTAAFDWADAVTVTIPQVEASKPEGLTQTATALGQTASSLSSKIDTQRATIDGLRAKWQGSASDAAIAKAQPTLLRLQDIHDALSRTQTALSGSVGGRWCRNWSTMP
jgi:WXG100 family type VII secretion target